MLLLCFAGVFLAVVNLVVNHFWPKRWFDLLPVLSYVCCLPFTLSCFYDVERRVVTGDISGLLDIYPDIVNGFILLFGVITVFNVAAIFLKGKGRL